MHSRENILNIIMLGTGQHRDRVKNILTSLAEAIEVDDHQFVHLIDGPAGKHRDKKHPMLGTYDVDVKFDSSTNQIHTQKTPRSALAKASELAGNVKGQGYEDAIHEVRLVVNEMILAGKTPLVVNLSGFSRGGDTMLRVANVLYGLYGDAVRVNILAVDPVPGIGRQHARKARVIPPNVDKYYVALMQDEKRVEFEAQNRSHVVLQNPNTQLKYFIYRGNHGFATKFEADPTKDDRPIHDSPTLLWDEVNRLAAEQNLSLKNNSPPDYVIAKKTPTAKTFTSVKSKPLSSAERLAAYTRMSISEQAYRDHVRTLSNYRSKFVRRREFVDRKFDYLIHGENCFQDKEHMLLFKQQFPAVFDYFFQQHLKKSRIDNVKNELAVINANPELKKFWHERTSIDHGDLANGALPSPQGVFVDADAFYNTKNELRRIWEGLVETVGAVNAGYDDSVSKATAQQLQQRMWAVLIGPDSDTDKIARLKSTLGAIAHERQNKKGGEFVYKLASIAGFLQIMDETVAERCIRKMEEYLNRPKIKEALFRNKELPLRKKAIMMTAQNSLRELIKHNLGNEAQPIQDILNIAYASVGEVRTTLDHPGEGGFEDTLRELALQISCYSPAQSLSEADQKNKLAVINGIINNYHQQMHYVLELVRYPRLQSYTQKTHRFIDIAQRILASRKDITHINKALASGEKLLNRLKAFDKKLWEDDPSRDLIKKQITTLSALQTTLELAQKEYSNKTYQPQSIVYMSQEAEVITAAPDQLATEVAKALSRSTPVAPIMGALSDTVPINATVDFVRDQARISSLNIKTGLGLFAKATTVKSVKWMQGTEFQSDIHFDPAQLSNFGSKGYLKWAMAEVDEFNHANPMEDKMIEFKGKLPEKFVRYAIAYCKIQNIPYLNNVNSKFEPTESDINNVRKEMAKPSHANVERRLNEMDISLRAMAADVQSIPIKSK